MQTMLVECSRRMSQTRIRVFTVFLFLNCFFFEVRETIQRSRNLFIVNFGEDTRNCINVTFIVSLKSK